MRSRLQRIWHVLLNRPIMYGVTFETPIVIGLIQNLLAQDVSILVGDK